MKKIISVFDDEKSPDMEMVSVYDDIAPPESGPVFWPEEISPWRDEGVSDPVEAPLGIMREQLTDPTEAAKRARDISDMAVELKLPIHLAEMYYNLLNDPPKARDPKVQGLISADPMPELQSTWGKFKNFFRGGDIEDLPPNPTREERLWKFFDIVLTKPMRIVLKYGGGRTLNMPEMVRIAMKRNTPKEHWTELDHMTIDEAYDYLSGYNPSGFEKMVGEIAEFIGRIQSVSYLAGKLGLVGNTPADMNALDKAAETAKLFALVSGEEEISKFGMMAFDPTETEYGYEGPKAILRDMALGAVFSFLHSGAQGLWKYLTPTEETRALKLLGLKKGATDEQITQAARDLARSYHPDKIKGYETEFKKVIDARNLLRQGETKDIVFRGANVRISPKLLTTEVEAKATEEAVRNRLRVAADILLRHGTKSNPMSTKWDLPAVRSLADLMFKPVPNTQEGINALVASAWETVMKEAQKPKGEIKSPAVQPPAAEGKAGLTEKELSRQVLLYRGSGGIASEAVKRSDIEQAAFRDKETGKVYKTGAIHLLDNLPAEVIIGTTENGVPIGKASLEPGFVKTDGTFLTRDQIADYKKVIENAKARPELLAQPPAAEGKEGIDYVTDHLGNKIPINPDGTFKQGGKMPEGAVARVLLYNNNVKARSSSNSGEAYVTKDGNIILDDNEYAVGESAYQYHQRFYKVPPPILIKELKEGYKPRIEQIIKDSPNRDPKDIENEVIQKNLEPYRFEIGGILHVGGPLDILQKQSIENYSDRGGRLGLTAIENLQGEQEATKVLEEVYDIPAERIDLTGPVYTKAQPVQPPAAEGKVEMNVTETPDGYFIEDIEGTGGADAIRKLQAEGKPIEAVIAKGGKNTEAARLRGAKALGFKEVGTTEQGAIKVRWEPEKVAPSVPAISITSPSRKGLANVEAAAKVAKYTVGLIEPAKVVTLKHGKEVTATVMRGIFGKAERTKVEFDNTTLENSDKTFRQLELEFDKYPQSVLHDLMVTRGHGLEDKARAIQKKAFGNLPDELKKSEVRRMIDDIADLNYEYLTKVTGEHIDTLWGEDIINKPNYIRDYFYGIYKDPAKINQFLMFWRTTDRFTKHKVFPTYADARAYGLELKNPNPIANLRAEHVAIARLESMQWLREELLKHGKGTLVDEIENAPMGWKVIGDPLRPEPTFSDLRVEPDLADLMNNLLARNKITGNPTLNAIRQANNIIRTVKFIGSGFHLIQVAKQSVADAGGYFGFLLPQRWIRYEQGKFKKGTAAIGFTTGFRKDDPFFQTELYLDYIENGGSQLGTLESEMKKAWKDAILQLNKGEQTVMKVATAPVKIPLAFVDWMFDSYIPKVKATKYAYEVAKQEKKLGRFLTPAEKQDIIKEQQNFYGEINEKLYGRRGTMTTAMRFYFTAPGYATGNYRTMAKAALQWGVGEQPSAKRSRYNIINSLALTTGIATIGTLLFTGKLPKKPETIEELRDLLRIDTGQKDEDGHRIMIDLASYEKDYWEVYFNTLTGHPGRAVEMAIKRIGGMRAPFAEFMTDMLQIAGGRQLYDWKNDEVYHITDPFLLKVNKLVHNEIERLIPISASVFKKEKEREVDTTIAAMEMLLGLRPTKDEATNRRFEVLKDLWSMRDQRDKQFYFLLTDPTPYESVEFYNQTLDTILNSKFLPAEDKAKWSEELKIDLSAYLKGKEETYQSPANTLEEAQQAKKYLMKFEIEPRGIWEGPKSLIDKLSKFNEKRRDLLRKEEKGTLTETQKAKLKLYRSSLSNLQNPAKLLLTKQNESQKQNTYRIIEGIINAPEVFEEIEP